MATSAPDGDSTSEENVYRGEDSPEDVMDAAVEVSPFETLVSIGNREGQFYATGRTEKDGFTKYRLHKPVDQGGEYAGMVGFRRGIGNREPIVRYFPVGDDAERETVEKIRVRRHGRGPKLASVLTALRTEVTDTDWAVNPGRTSYGEWTRAANTLRDFAAEECSHLTNEEEAIIHEPEVTHAIARYPLDAREVMNSVETAILRRDDLSFEDVNPEAVREILLGYVRERVE